MSEPLPINKLLEEWLRWATWISDANRNEHLTDQLIGFDEFEWIVRDKPEHAWQAILAAVSDPRIEPHLPTLAAGPMEDLLSYHGATFIERVEAEARSNPKFASFLGGVWQFEMPSEIWERVQKVWDRKGWDGIQNGDC